MVNKGNFLIRFIITARTLNALKLKFLWDIQGEPSSRQLCIRCGTFQPSEGEFLVDSLGGLGGVHGSRWGRINETGIGSGSLQPELWRAGRVGWLNKCPSLGWCFLRWSARRGWVGPGPVARGQGEVEKGAVCLRRSGRPRPGCLVSSL